MSTESKNPVVRRNRLEWLQLVVGLALVGAFFVFLLAREDERIQTSERSRLTVLKNVMADNIQKNLAAANRALEGVIKDYLGGPVINSQTEVSRRLRVLADTMQGIRGTLVLDDKGIVLAANSAEMVGQDFSQRDYFKTVRDHPGKSTLYLSAPFQSLQNDLVVTLARMVPGPQGEFAGLVLATLDPAYFTSLFQTIVYAPDVWVFVDHGDGIRLINFPEKAGLHDQDITQPNSFFSRHLHSGETDSLLTGKVFATGEQRLMAMRTIQPADLAMDKALVIGVSRNLVAMAQPLRHLMLIDGLFYAVLTVLGCSAVLGAQRRRSQKEAWDADRARERAQANECLKAAQRQANLGNWVWDIASNTHTWSEEIYRIYGRDPALPPAIYPEVQQYFTPSSWA